jgi:type IX secretion system PorP/SprF family membrane protein
MSNPSFSNIDRWLFELNEGNLSPEQVHQLKVFLLQHPELDIDKNMWELARVQKTEVVFPNQDKFIKRKPVGLFMMAGLVSIAIFVLIGLDILTSDGINSSQVNIIAQSTQKTQFQAQNIVNKPSGMPDNVSKDGNKDGVEIKEELIAGTQLLVSTGLANVALRGTDLSDFSKQGLSTKVKEQFKSPVQSSSIGSLENEGGVNTLSNPVILNEEDKRNENRSLATSPVKELEILVTRNWVEANSRTSFFKGNSVEHSASISSKMNKAVRAFSRMMDNPVALKNLKDPSFHLPGMLPYDVNFGNVGTASGTRIQTLTRLQWPNLENQQLINQVAFDSYVYAIRGGVGAQVNHAYYGNGEIMNSNLALTYSPKISVNRNILVEPSLRFKMGNKTLDPDKISGFGFAEMDRENVQQFYPTGTTPIGQQLWYRDLGLGMMVNTKWFFVGVQGDNLFRHYDNIYSGQDALDRRVDQHFIATIGTDYESKRELIGLSPYIVYQQKESLKELWMGVNTRLNWFTMGLAVSDKMDAVASAGIKFDRFAFCYQADYTHSALWDKQFLSHQVSLKFTTFNSNKKQKFINL